MPNPLPSGAPVCLEPDRAPIFVVGTGRSGTTLLRLLLNAHPRIYLTHEASFYLIGSGLSKGPSASQWLERYMRSAVFAWLRLNPALVRAELTAAGDPKEPKEAYRAIMRLKAARYGRVRYGDKTPLHAGRLDRILSDFPEARVIHVVRDPRATVASLMRMPWAASSVGLNNLFCLRSMRGVRPFSDRLLEIRLEDLLGDLEASLRRVLDFVGEAWHPDVLDHAQHAPLDDVPPFPWFAAAKRPVRARAGRPVWLEQLDPAWVRNIEQLHRAEMERLDYSPVSLEREPSFLDRQRVRIADLPEVYHSLVHRRRLLRLTRGQVVPDPREIMATLLSWNPAAWRLYPDFVMPSLPRPEDSP